jgi:peptidyl-prolyl cis-trans isomerase C
MRWNWTFAVLSSVAVACPAIAQSAKPIAVVNGEAIPRAEFDAIRKLRPTAVTPQTAAQIKAENEQIVTFLIDEALFRQFLAKETTAAKSDEVKAQFTSLTESLKAQNKTLADYCKQTQQTEAQIRSNIDSIIRWTAYVSKKVTDAELQAYYQENKDFFDKVTVKCSHIVLRLAPDAPAAERAEAAAKLKELRQQIITGKTTFADAAQKFSQCPSAARGGNIGYVYRKWMVEEPFAKAAFAAKVNDITDVVSTDAGVHIIFVSDRKPAEPSDFNKIKDDVRDCCGEEMRQKLIGDLRKAAKIEVNLQ